MAEGLTTPDGEKLDVPPVGDADARAQFDKAMAAPEPGDPQVPAPPPKDPDAPYGRTKDGKPKKGPGGRPPKAEKPRVQKPRAPQVKRDFTEDLTGLVQVSWGVLVAVSPADAAAVHRHGPGMVQAWNALAQEDARVARGIQWLTTGSTYGAVVMATAPLLLQVMANHRRIPHERFAAFGVADPAELAAETFDMVTHMTQAPAAAAA